MLASLTAATLTVAGTALTQTAVDGAADRYIVVLEDDVENPSRVASGIEQRQEDLEVGFVYSSALEGFSATIPDEDLAAVRADPRVDYVEPDGRVRAVAQTIPWSIDKIGATQSSTWAGDGPGVISSVNVYIIDTGIYRQQLDLNVVNHVNFAGGKNKDCNGHGTHVAGTVAAKDNDRGVVGVAPGAPLTGVKVIGCSGSGFISNVIAGIDFVNRDVIGPDGEVGTDDDKKPAIANLSLSTEVARTPGADLLDAAVRKSARDIGVFYSAAAGNKGKNACNYSPASAGFADEDTNGNGEITHHDSNGIVTTAAVTFFREETVWSNYGPCVDLWAPGKNILSTNNGRGKTTMSGTSMAAAHISGAAALYLSNTINAEATPVVVEETLKVDAVRVENPEKISKDDQRRIRFVYAGNY